MKMDSYHARFDKKWYRSFLIFAITLATPVMLVAQATKITSAEGRYTVVFPAPAERQYNPPKTENGLTYAIEMYTASLNGQIFRTVSTSYQGAQINTQKELQANVDNFVKALSAKLTSTTPTEYVSRAGNIPGTAFTCETDQLTIQGRFFVAGNDVWGIVYAARKGAESEAMKEQFFRSLEINRLPGRGAHG